MKNWTPTTSLENQLHHEGIQDTDTDQPTNWTHITQQAQQELNTLKQITQI